MRICSGSLGRPAFTVFAAFAVALLSVPPVAAGPASAFGPEVPVGRPRDGYVGTMRVAPLHGQTGAPFTITAEDLPPDQEFQLIWRTVNGQWNVTEAEYHGRELCRLPTRWRGCEAMRTGACGRPSRRRRTSGSFTTSSCSRVIA